MRSDQLKKLWDFQKALYKISFNALVHRSTAYFYNTVLTSIRLLNCRQVKSKVKHIQSQSFNIDEEFLQTYFGNS